MGWATAAIHALKDGATVTIRPRGSSMEPLVHSGQECVIEPVSIANVQKGDIVLCVVHGREYLHLVKAKNKGSVLIGNNRGGINGWTTKVFGRMR